MLRHPTTWTYGFGVMIASVVAFLTGLSWPVALASLGLGLPTVLLAGRRIVGRRHEVVAVRSDPDFGRIALFDDGRWEGAVALSGIDRPVDVEIEGAVSGPTLAQRLAYQDACAEVGSILGELADEVGLEEQDFRRRAQFLRLRLPGQVDGAPTWALSYVMGDAGDAECREVAVDGGRIVGVSAARA